MSENGPKRKRLHIDDSGGRSSAKNGSGTKGNITPSNRVQANHRTSIAPSRHDWMTDHLRYVQQVLDDVSSSGVDVADSEFPDDGIEITTQPEENDGDSSYQPDQMSYDRGERMFGNISPVIANHVYEQDDVEESSNELPGPRNLQVATGMAGTVDNDINPFEKVGGGSFDENSQHEQESHSSHSQMEQAGPPKKPTAAFYMFCNEMRPRVRDANPTYSWKDVTATISAMWKEMDDVARRPYNDEYNRQNAAYKSAMAEFEKASVEDAHQSVLDDFPSKLFSILSKPTIQNVISWNTDGLSWSIHKLDEFGVDILPSEFPNVRLTTFLEMVICWGFNKLKIRGGIGFSHKLFRRDKPKLSLEMVRSNEPMTEHAPKKKTGSSKRPQQPRKKQHCDAKQSQGNGRPSPKRTEHVINNQVVPTRGEQTHRKPRSETHPNHYEPTRGEQTHRKQPQQAKPRSETHPNHYEPTRGEQTNRKKPPMQAPSERHPYHFEPTHGEHSHRKKPPMQAPSETHGNHFEPTRGEHSHRKKPPMQAPSERHPNHFEPTRGEPSHRKKPPMQFASETHGNHFEPTRGEPSHRKKPPMQFASETHPMQAPNETHPTQIPDETHPMQAPNETHPTQLPYETHPNQITPNRAVQSHYIFPTTAMGTTHHNIHNSLSDVNSWQDQHLRHDVAHYNNRNMGHLWSPNAQVPNKGHSIHTPNNHVSSPHYPRFPYGGHPVSMQHQTTWTNPMLGNGMTDSMNYGRGRGFLQHTIHDNFGDSHGWQVQNQQTYGENFYDPMMSTTPRDTASYVGNHFSHPTASHHGYPDVPRSNRGRQLPP